MKNCNLTTEVLKENTLVSFYIKKIKANIKIKINKLKHDENRWSIKAIPIEGPFQHIEAESSLVKLGENETFVGCLSKYSKPLDSKNRKKFQKEKRKRLLSLKKS